MTFREFAIDTAYRCGWTFTQALLSCMTFVLLKQIGKWCLAHIKDTSDLTTQTTFNDDSYIDMKGVPHYEDTDIPTEQ